ncbi:MAG: hypothetical protein ABIB72_01780 [Candidatus Falkowbacteria bacterium]
MGRKQQVKKAFAEVGSSTLGISKDKLAEKIQDESANLLKKLRMNKGSLKHLVWRMKFYLDVRISDEDIAQIKTVGNLLEMFVVAMDNTTPVVNPYDHVLTAISGK